MRRRAGVTLIELLVVIAILAIVTGLSSVALRRAESPRGTDADHDLLTLRRDAIRAGTPLTRVVRRGTALHVVTALADGRMLSDSAMHVDPATGAFHDAAR